jgi:lipoprotein-anchoring transpeptidase ErfK/SrfK
VTAHRGRAKPRYGRLALLCSSTTVTMVSVLGGIGALPSSADPPAPRPEAAVELAGTGVPPTPPASPATAGPGARALESASAPDDALPADSGAGRRVVFSESRQRVWLVAADGEVRRTYPVSGSAHDNLDTGTYEVYSRSARAWGIEDSGSMRWFVRFAQGDAGAAIGFHDIPVDAGRKVQTAAQLGTPLSHGCIRQRTRDAKAMWRFAPLGTTVVVTP